jgi:hypothetical protein
MASVFNGEQESNRGYRENKGEKKDIGHEEREEHTEDKELQAVAAMERADYLVREVKTNKNQMQNIIVHMQSVMQAIRDLRAALQLPVHSNDDESIIQDKKRMEDLHKKIAAYVDELYAMKEDLVNEHMINLQKEHPTKNADELRVQAEHIVENILVEIKK